MTVRKLTMLVIAIFVVSLMPMQAIASSTEPGIELTRYQVVQTATGDGQLLETFVFGVKLDSSLYPSQSLTLKSRVRLETSSGTGSELAYYQTNAPFVVNADESLIYSVSYYASSMQGCAPSPENPAKCWLLLELEVVDVGSGGDTSKIGTIAGSVNFTSVTFIKDIQPPPVGGCDLAFLDVACEHQAYDAVNELVDKGITTGCQLTPDPLFCPDRSVTRGEMAAFIARAMQLSPLSSDTFCDDNGHFAEGHIEAIAAAGVTQGIGGCNYGPNVTIPRWQMALFLSRALNLTIPPPPYTTFSDTSGLSQEAQGAIEAIAAAGITQGTSPGVYNPFGAVTRWQMALFLSRAF